MGPNTWTERLAQAVEQRPRKSTLCCAPVLELTVPGLTRAWPFVEDISLRVDGPYGRPLYFDQCR
jgi:hypothetical protein